MKEKEMFTLHENFGLAHDFLYEAISNKYSEKKLLKMIEGFLYDFSTNKVVEVSEEDISEWIENCIFETNNFYERGQITEEERNQYIKQDSDRKKVKQLLEQEGMPLQEVIASAEYISALLNKPTNSFLFFLELHKFDNNIETNFEKIQKRFNNSSTFKELISKILTVVITKIKKDNIIETLGIYDENHINEWKVSVNELEENLKSLL